MNEINYVNKIKLAHVYIVSENIIATIKILLSFKNNNFYNIVIAILAFLYCFPFSYRSSNFALAKVIALNIFA